MQVLGRPDSQFYGWRILFAVPLLFALFQGVTLPWCPESPRFLYIKRRDEKATIRGRDIHRTITDISSVDTIHQNFVALIRLRGTTDIDDELQAMKVKMLVLPNDDHMTVM